MSEYVTRFGSLDSYTKGGVEIIDDDPKHYTFSNIFEVASKAKPYQKIAVAKNIQYVVEVQRAEGTSDWRAAAHDEGAPAANREGDGVHKPYLPADAIRPRARGATRRALRRARHPAGARHRHAVGQ